MKNRFNTSESGFSLIELLTIVAIIGVLSGLGMVAFNTYKMNAEMAKGDSTYRNARTKLAISELDLPPGYNMAWTESTTDGAVMSGDLGAVMPGLSPGKNVRLGVAMRICEGSDDPLDISQLIVVEPCRADRKIQFERFCGGIEVLSTRVSNPAPCT